MSTVKTDSVIGSFLPIPVIEHATDSEVYTATAGQTVFTTTKFDRSNAIRVIAKSSGGAFSDVPASWTAANTVTITGTILGAGQIVYIFKVGTHASKVRVQDANGTWVDLSTYSQTLAQKGANNDITALNALITPITPAQGGVSSGYIEGLIPSRSVASGLTLTIGTGAAFMPATGKVLQVTTPITSVLSGFAADTWVYAYLYDSGSGVAAIEWSATVPAAPYFGTARTKTGDTSRRFLCVLKINTAATAVTYFQWRKDHTRILGGLNVAPWRIINAAQGTPGTPTTLSLSPGTPPTTDRAFVIVSLSAASGGTHDVYFCTPETNGVLTGYLTGNTTAVRHWVELTVNASQQIQWWFSSAVTGQAFTLDVIGYGNDR
jgi:hypothetical protein